MNPFAAIAALSTLSPIEEIAALSFWKGQGMKPFLVIAIGGAMVYLAVTGKAAASLKAIFGR